MNRLPPILLAAALAGGLVPAPGRSQAPEVTVTAAACEWIVAGRPPAGTLSLPWHETALPGFRDPFARPAPAALRATGEMPLGLGEAAAVGSGAEASGAEASGAAGSGAEASAAPGDGEPPAPEPADDASGAQAAAPARSLLLAGRAGEAWRALSGVEATPGGELAFVRAWAAARSGVPAAAELLAPFAAPAAPLACRAPARRARAVALAAAGDSAGSERSLAALRGELPELPEHVLLWSIEAAAAGRRDLETEALYDSLLAIRPGAALLRSADRARADLHERAGRRDRAAAVLARMSRDAPRDERPALLLRLARLEEASGERASALARRRRIVVDHPASGEALALVASVGTAGAGFPAVDRARVLAAHGLVAEAVAALTPADGVAELRLRGDIRLRSGDYAMAAADYGEALGLGGDPDELRREMAKAHARGGEPERALALYRQLEAEGAARGEGSADLAYLIADALQEASADDPALADAAVARFRVLAARFPRSSLAARGMLRSAHLEFARGRWGAAASLYRDYLRRHAAREDAAEARYWLARSLGRGGDRAAERAALADLLRPGEDGYYEILARRRLEGDSEAAVAELFAAPAAGEALRAAPADTVLPAGGPAGRPLRRARALLLVGEPAAAQREIDEALRLAGGSSAELARVARWALARGFPESAFRIGWALVAGGRADEATARLAFPAAFADLVAFEAEEHGLSPSLVWAIMRQESRFDPTALSPAGAVGLLQLIPATAREEATRGGVVGFDPRDLLRPEPNLHLGAAHLRALLDQVGGDTVAAIAAYNAGLPQAGRWRALPEVGSPEAYVERIPFRETRAYVKIVLANRAHYEALYAAPRP